MYAHQGKAAGLQAGSRQAHGQRNSRQHGARTAANQKQSQLGKGKSSRAGGRASGMELTNAGGEVGKLLVGARAALLDLRADAVDRGVLRGLRTSAERQSQTDCCSSSRARASSVARSAQDTEQEAHAHTKGADDIPRSAERSTHQPKGKTSQRMTLRKWLNRDGIDGCTIEVARFW